MRAAEPDGRHYWLELKRAKAPLSEAQERFRQELVDRTVVHGIVRSFDEAVACLKTWDVLRGVTPIFNSRFAKPKPPSN